MATQPKADAPDHYWVEFVAEIEALVTGDAALQERFRRLLSFNLDMELLNMASFCAASQPIYSEPTEAEFQAGTWRDRYRDAVLQGLYYRFCEEV